MPSSGVEKISGFSGPAKSLYDLNCPLVPKIFMGFGLKWEYADLYKDKKVRVDKKLFLPAVKNKFLTCSKDNRELKCQCDHSSNC